MRALLVILGLLVLAVAAAMQFGYLSIGQTRPGMVQTPQFNADVARVSVGREERSVQVPTIDVRKPGATPTPAP
ncbi:MAG TPA: hypothetical protein VF695_08545 [Sphingomonas sp.]|jgi:hypothetical protein